MIEEESPTQAPPEEEPSLRKQFFRLRTLVAFAVSFAIIYIFVSRLNIDLAETWGIISGANPALYLLAAVVYYSAFPLRGLRWRLILRNVGFGQGGDGQLPSPWTLGRFMAMGWFANCILPAKMGDAYRAFLAKRAMGTSFSKTAGTVLAERVIDVMVVFLLLAASSLVVLRSTQAEAAFRIVLVGLALVLIVALGLAVMARLGGFIQRLLPHRFQDIYQLFHEGTFRSFRNLPAIVVLSIAVWLAEAGRVYLVSRSLGFSLDPALILFVALTEALLVGLPLTPGGLGVVEAGLAAILMLAVSKEQAASVALLDRSLSYWSILAFGALLHLWGLRRARAHRARLYPSD